MDPSECRQMSLLKVVSWFNQDSTRIALHGFTTSWLEKLFPFPFVEVLSTMTLFMDLTVVPSCINVDIPKNPSLKQVPAYPIKNAWRALATLNLNPRTNAKKSQAEIYGTQFRRTCFYSTSAAWRHHHHRRRCRRRHKNTTKNNIITTSKTPPKHDYHHQSTTKGKTLLSPQKHHYKNTTKTAPVTVTNAFDVLLDILFFSPDGNASFSLFLSPDDGDYYGRGGSN